MSDAMKFQLSEAQEKKLSDWVDEKNFALAEEQLKDPVHSHLVMKSTDGRLYPYLGAIGGSVSIMFTPTGIGDFVTAYWCRGSTNEDELDLTEYDLL